MAANLLKAGHGLHVHNRTPAAATALVEAGAHWCPTAAEAAAAAPVTCLCLSDDEAVRTVLLGAGSSDPTAAFCGLRQGSLVIDFSTISPATSQMLAQQLGAHGVGYLDAPVTGGTEGARAGTLSVLVGGDPSALERARPILELVGGRISHLGPVGSGQQAKAINQVLVAGSYAAVAEALALGERLGLPMPTVLEALGAGAAGSWALQHRANNMLVGDYPLGFKLALHRKDLAIALQTAANVDLDLPISSLVASLEDALIEAGHGERDVSALAEWFRR